MSRAVTQRKLRGLWTDVMTPFTYTGGYVLPGNTPGPGQYVLPSDLEQAAVEQVAFWFQTRDKLGLKTQWPHLGTYEAFLPLDLLPGVKTVLTAYQRFSL